MTETKAKKKFKMPGTCALLFLICIVCAIATWIVPAGEFDREGTKVIAGSFHYIERHGQGLWDLFLAVSTGFANQAKLMFMIFFTGGSIAVLDATGSIDAVLGRLSNVSRSGRNAVLILITLFMSIGGAAGIFSTQIVALVPIGLTLAMKMGFDPFVGFWIIYMGTYSGFNVGWANAPTIGTAHTIAELPMFSGMGPRILFHIVNFALCIIFMFWYIKRIERDYTLSAVYHDGMTREQIMGAGTDAESVELKTIHIVSIVVFFATIALMLFGSIKLGWSYPQIGSIFLVSMIIVGFINRISYGDIFDLFLKGCADMVNAAFIVGFANAISVILGNGKIMDTIVYALSIPISHVGPVFGAVLMFWSNLLINVVIPSGSGQAAAVMPIMTPVSDLCGITRQVAVQAFQFGDGLSNCIIPNAGTLMACLGLCKIEYGRYVKVFLPCFIIQIILASVAMAVLQMVGWTGL